MVLSTGTRENLNCSCPAKNPNNKTESINPEYSKIQTQSGKMCIMLML